MLTYTNTKQLAIGIMNTLLTLKENIPLTYKYKQSLYDTSKAVRQKNGFGSTIMNAPATSKIKYCAAATKNEYNAGKSPSNVSFGGLSSSKVFKKLLEKSADNGALCSAAAMLLACGVLRPASIMASQNVDIENRKVAATKSIASGIIGFILMFLVSKPIEHAVKKINKAPASYLKEKTIETLKEGANDINKSGAYNLATRFFKMSADMIVAAPKGSLTIIMIPPLLNIIFKNGKKQTQNNLFPKEITQFMPTPHATDAQDFADERNYVFFKGAKKSNTSASNNISFKGNPIVKGYGNVIEWLAKGFGKILDNEKVQKFASKYKNSSIENHEMAAAGTIVSTFYVINTLKSKKIEEERKGPLIYNSIISWAIATSGAYTVDKLLNKYLKNFEKNYKKVNAAEKNLDKQLRGIKIMKSALIFGMMYRWVTPWISTILAENIWNKKLAKKSNKSKLSQANKA